MKITILTLFSEFTQKYLDTSIIKNALKNNLLEIEIVDFRQYSTLKNKSVDDYQYGGGPGMVLMIEPIVKALRDVSQPNSYKILLDPKAKVLNNQTIKKLSLQDHLILIAGHYEGFDERIKNYIDETISIGDYVLTGGELPALILLDTISRQIDGVINADSLICESFENNLLDYPIYTKPQVFEGHEVPQILLSGNHQKIAEYRLQEQIKITKKYRPDLLLTKKDSKEKK